MRRVRATIVVLEEQWLLHNLSICICRLSYPACNAHTPYCHVACPTLKHVATLSHKLHDFREKSSWTQNVCFDFFYKIVLKHFSYWKELTGMWSEMCIGFRVKYRLFLSDFNDTWIFSTDFQKKIIKFLKIPPSGSRIIPCGRIDRQTDMTKLIIAFLNFAKAPNRGGCCVSCQCLPFGPGFRARPGHV
jgi:hypothetical protein